MAVLADDGIFSRELKMQYRTAFDLNEQQQYIEAYSAICSADRQLEAEMSAGGVNATRLSTRDFQQFYLPIKKSLAEIAYKLGNHTQMREVINALSMALKAQASALDVATQEGYQADIAKLEGGCFYLTEQFDSAETALHEAIRLNPDPLSDFAYKVHDDLAQLYYRQERYTEALNELDLILQNPPFSANSRRKASNAERMDIISQRAMCLARLGQHKAALKAIDTVLKYYSRASNPRNLAEALRKKGKILMLQYQHTGNIKSRSMSAQCYQEYLEVAKDYVDTALAHLTPSEQEQFWVAEQPFIADAYRLEEQDPALIYNLALFSKALLLRGQSARVDWQQIQRHLPDKACAIEFIVYERDSVQHLAAVVVNKTATSPQFIHLAKVSDIFDLPLLPDVDVKRVLSNRVSSGNNTDTLWINTLYRSQELTDAFWPAAMVQAIGDCRHVYFAADGICHQIGVEYLLPQALQDKHFYRLTTTRILADSQRSTRTSSLMLCGDINYTRQSQDATAVSNDELAYHNMHDSKPLLNPISFSRASLDSIRSLRDSHASDVMLERDSATEAAVRELWNNYHIAFISTHGFFSEVENIGTDLHPAYADEQLSKNCLFLAGSDSTLKAPAFNPSETDGILSAREIADMDLHDVDLTVMAACMSGMGYITPDGVFGLQRGLKIAGVKAVVASLWSVDGRATNHLMRFLFTNLQQGQPLHEAFENARLQLKTYVEEQVFGTTRPTIIRKTFNTPYNYNAFILIDGL